MGVDYRVWIFPKDRTYRPASDRVADLANALRVDGWAPMPGDSGQHSAFSELLPGHDPAGRRNSRTQEFASELFTPAWIEFYGQHELILNWHVRNMREAGVRYPFVFDPYPDSGPPYFYIRVLVGKDYFYWTGENVMEFDEQSTLCVCGAQLTYGAGYAPGTSSMRIHSICPKCMRTFDPSDKECDVLDGWTGVRTKLAGGVTFHFALIVDCHKYWPRDEEAGRRFRLKPQFLDLWHKFIGVPYVQVETFD